MSTAPRSISLNGVWSASHFELGEGEARGVFKKEHATEGWIAGKVPGCAQLDAFGGTIEELYYATNAEKVMWVEKKEWWYKRDFETPAHFNGKRIWLCFEGVDFSSHVWLNGEKIADHLGTFSPFEIEITRHVRPAGQSNHLAVLIDRAYHNVAMKSPVGNEYDWSLWLEQLGIWENVTLVATGAARIKHVQLIPKVEAPYQSASFKVTAEIDASAPGDYELDVVACEDDTGNQVFHASETVRLEKGVNKRTLEGTIGNVRLWQPNGYGEQALYQAEVSIGQAAGEKVSDARTEQFGFREIIFENGAGMEPPTPEWIFRINGRRIFVRGINWVPADQLSATMTRERYKHLIRLVADTKSVIMRMWGGGGRQKKDFYDFCDRYGIMLQQEFPLANQAIPEQEDLHAYCSIEAEGMVRHIINHPSIVQWAGGNEFNFDPDNPLLIKLGQVCNRIDPTRRYLNTSPMGQETHSPWEYSFPGYYDIYNKYRQNLPMLSEFGCPGMVGLKSLSKFMPPEELEFPPERVPPYCEITLAKPVKAKHVRMTISRVENACKAYNDIFNCCLPDGTDVTPYEARALYNWRTAASGSFPVIDAFDIVDETGENLALKKKGAKIKASSERLKAAEIKRRWPSVPDSLFGAADNIIDGQYGHHRCWVSNEVHSGWFEIELPKTAIIRKFIWSRDRLGKYWNNIPIDYTIEVSNDGREWEAAYVKIADSRSSHFNLYNSWAYHKGILGYDGFETWLYEDNLAALFGVPRDPQAYVNANQYVQSEGTRYCLEHMRRMKYHPAGGCCFWQYDEPWPNISCDAIVDWYGETKPAFYFLARAYEDHHVSARYSAILWRPGSMFEAEIWTHNDRLEETPCCRLDMSIRSLDGKILWQKSLKTQLLSDSCGAIDTVRWQAPAAMDDDVFSLDLRLWDGHEKLLSSNQYFYGTAMPVLQPMLSAPHTRITAAPDELRIRVSGNRESGEKLTITNSGNPYALMVNCRLDFKDGLEPFFAYYADNDVILWADQTAEIPLKLAAREMTPKGSYKAEMIIKGWNTNEIRLPVEIIRED